MKGGEERTIEFMEREGRASYKTPLLEHGSERGTVTHPFPMNYILKPWKLGQWFYQLVKIGIVQYVCFLSLSEVLAFVAFFLFSDLSLFLCLIGVSSIFLWQMIIKSLTALLAVVLEAFGVYCEGEFKWGCG